MRGMATHRERCQRGGYGHARRHVLVCAGRVEPDLVDESVSKAAVLVSTTAVHNLIPCAAVARRAEERAQWNLWADAPKGTVKGGIEMREERIALTTSPNGYVW
eukprot:COSAG02_NODE_2606_length_8439_cov_10.095204_4_plen_104_part_00